jgi:hypothetical protein
MIVMSSNKECHGIPLYPRFSIPRATRGHHNNQRRIRVAKSIGVRAELFISAAHGSLDAHYVYANSSLRAAIGISSGASAHPRIRASAHRRTGATGSITGGFPTARCRCAP